MNTTMDAYNHLPPALAKLLANGCIPTPDPLKVECSGCGSKTHKLGAACHKCGKALDDPEGEDRRLDELADLFEDDVIDTGSDPGSDPGWILDVTERVVTDLQALGFCGDERVEDLANKALVKARRMRRVARHHFEEGDNNGR